MEKIIFILTLLFTHFSMAQGISLSSCTNLVDDIIECTSPQLFVNEKSSFIHYNDITAQGWCHRLGKELVSVEINLLYSGSFAILTESGDLYSEQTVESYEDIKSVPIISKIYCY
ncbi:MAG: hypothetical protein CME66_04490 [Halobacteriovoraceae bacterium]|nr:hypothetical protein [Halobacteriovoraceae bacterium]|tara:strand:+ start:564 stop:908 length:345 start_codon:yes stop_codon:yes gene_type:complete